MTTRPTAVLIVGATGGIGHYAVAEARSGAPYAEWKLRGERLVRASGHPYTIVRPGWFDYNDNDQRRIVMLQGDTRQSGTPDTRDSLDGPEDAPVLPLDHEPELFRSDLTAVRRAS